MRSLITRPRVFAVLLAGSALAFSPLGGQATAQVPVEQLSTPCLTPAEGPWPGRPLVAASVPILAR